MVGPMELFTPFLNQFCLWLFASLMIVAAWSDTIDFTIPNRLIVSLLVLYPAFVMTAANAIDWPMALALATGILALGLVLYGWGKMGAGDVKLIAATAVWAGTEHTLDFMLLTAIAGGVVCLAIAALVSVAAVTALTSVGTSLSSMFSKVSSDLNAAVAP